MAPPETKRSSTTIELRKKHHQQKCWWWRVSWARTGDAWVFATPRDYGEKKISTRGPKIPCKNAQKRRQLAARKRFLGPRDPKIHAKMRKKNNFPPGDPKTQGKMRNSGEKLGARSRKSSKSMEEWAKVAINHAAPWLRRRVVIGKGGCNSGGC